MDVFIKQHSLRWGASSNLIKDWLAVNDSQKSLQHHFGVEWTYEKYLTAFESKSSSHYEEDSKDIKLDVMSGRTDILLFNYS